MLKSNVFVHNKGYYEHMMVSSKFYKKTVIKEVSIQVVTLQQLHSISHNRVVIELQRKV